VETTSLLRNKLVARCNSTVFYERDVHDVRPRSERNRRLCILRNRWMKSYTEIRSRYASRKKITREIAHLARRLLSFRLNNHGAPCAPCAPCALVVPLSCMLSHRHPLDEIQRSTQIATQRANIIFIPIVRHAPPRYLSPARRPTHAPLFVKLD